MPYKSKAIDFFSAIEYFQQDTIENQTLISQPANFDSKNQNNLTRDTSRLKSVEQMDFSAIDSILKRSEERERQIQEQAEKHAAYLRWKNRKIDTSEILYKQFGISNFPNAEKLEKDPFQQNFLYNISHVKPEKKEVNQSVFLESQEAINVKKENLRESTLKKTDFKPKTLPERIHFDWITIILIASFLLLGWIRLFNKKYLISLFKSTVNYQESNKLYREKNSIMERASFVVNLLFLSNISLFVIQLKHFFDISFNGLEDYLLYLIALGSLVALYIFRALTSSFIGFVFLKQKEFSEYFHNVNIFTKNTGLVLLPIVVILQFMTYEYIGFIIYTGIIFSALLYLLEIIRSFQIFNRKNVSIFYMILYLCAFEFAPFLIIYKILLSLA